MCLSQSRASLPGAVETSGRSREAGRIEAWSRALRQELTDSRVPIHLMGAGNELRGDDAAGLEIVSRLRSKLRGIPTHGVKIHASGPSPDRLLGELASGDGRIVIFDAVEASRQPGDVVFCPLSDTKYGFFATHNIPLRLVPGLARREGVFLVGVQPESLEVGEGLSDAVSKSVQRVVAVVAEGVKARK